MKGPSAKARPKTASRVKVRRARKGVAGVASVIAAAVTAPLTPPMERRRQTPETLRLRSITPSLTVDDVRKSLAFYTDVLGFVVSEYWTDDEGQIRGVMLKAGLCELGLQQDDWARGRERPKGEGVRIWCDTAQDIDMLAGRIREAGFAMTEEPKDQSWGSRSLSLDDPNGYHLTISRRL